MKIIEVAPGVMPIPPTGFGAIERVVWNLYLSLTELGHSVKIYNKPNVSSLNWDGESAIHVHWHSHAHALARMGIPYAYTSHSHIWRNTCAKAIAESSVYLPLHDGMVPGSYKGPVFPVGNGVNTDFWANFGGKREKIVVAVANYSKRKRLEWMFELIEQLGGDWQGLVIGPGVPENMDKKPGINVELTGELSQTELRGIFNACAVGFHPAKYEAFALVPLEMASCGLQTYVHKDCNVYGNTGAVIEFLSPDSASYSINFLDDGEFYESNKINPTEIVRKHHSWSAVAKRVEEGLKSLV